MKFKRIYSLDENFFEKIDTERKAYILGFVYADGNNKSQNSGLSITISYDDKELLEEIKNELKSNAKITEQNINGFKQVHIDFNSYKLSRDLEKQGCYKNKTYKIVFPLFLDESLMNHFIRGYFDGDGCIWEGERKKMLIRDKNTKTGFKNKTVHNVKFTVTSNTNFILGLQNYLVEHLGFKRNKIFNRNKNNTAISTLEYSGRGNVKKLYDFMYNNSTICLKRKYDKFKKIIDFKNSLENENISNS